jgi:predicted DNA-binding transcriptional regulator AlpA
METTKAERLDPLRTMTFNQVVQRTGFSRRTIDRLLADDVANNTPGLNFAAPIRRPDSNKLIWRECTVIKWMERMEARVA